MPRITDPALLASLETPQATINKGATTSLPGGPQLSGDARNVALQKIAALRALGRQVQVSSHEFDRTQNGRGVYQSISEFTPSLFSPDNAKYDATVDSMTPLAKAAFRVPGSGADSDKESAAFLALVPSRYGNDTGNIEKYRQMSNIIQGSIADQRRLLGIKTAPGGPVRRQKAAAPVAAQVIDFNDLKD